MSVPAVRPVPNIFGELRVGDTLATMDINTKRVAGFAIPAPQRVVKLSLACDGGGTGAPTAKVRGVIYQSDVLIAMGDEVTVQANDPLRWVDLPFLGAYPDGVLVPSGSVELGAICGGDANVLRVAQIDPQSPGGRFNADSYADGASNPFGSTSPLTATMSIFATASPTWQPRDLIDPAVLARLGWLTAQELLESGVLVTPTFDTSATWHGTSVDPNRGSFAVVRAGSDLAGLVGQRLKVTTRRTNPRSCFVYVFQAISTLDADLSLARRAFAELELLAADSVDVHVEVLG